MAIPRFGETIAPCFEHTATICIFAIQGDRVVDETDFHLPSRHALDRVRLLRDQQVDTLICGGIESGFQVMVEGMGIEVISWVSGEVEGLLDLFVRGELVPGRMEGSDEC